MTVKSVQCDSCGKSSARWIIVDKGEENKFRWCRNCSNKSGLNFEVEYRRLVNQGTFIKDRKRIKQNLPPE